MGAISAIWRLRWRAFQDDVAPALRARVATTRDAVGWIRAALAESRDADALAPLRRGLGVERFGDCELLRPDLGVRDDDALLLATYSSIGGACHSTTCTERLTCPLHRETQSRISSEVFGYEFQRIFEQQCCESQTWLGRQGDWFGLSRWWAMEQGRFEPDADEVARVPVLRLLLRLGKRGAAIGWADGGSGEGLLGWLSPAETRELVTQLETVGAAIDAPTASELDPYSADVELPGLRDVVSIIADVARQACAAGDGVALTRH